MRKWVTYVDAVSPKTGEMCSFFGPYVPGDTRGEAESYCERNGLGYCRVDSELLSEIPTKPDGNPDWENRTEHEQ